MLVEVRPFNDRQMNRDLRELCQRVEAGGLCLPDGRQLPLRIEGKDQIKPDTPMNQVG